MTSPPNPFNARLQVAVLAPEEQVHRKNHACHERSGPDPDREGNPVVEPGVVPRQRRQHSYVDTRRLRLPSLDAPYAPLEASALPLSFRHSTFEPFDCILESLLSIAPHRRRRLTRGLRVLRPPSSPRGLFRRVSDRLRPLPRVLCVARAAGSRSGSRRLTTVSASPVPLLFRASDYGISGELC